MGALMDAPEYKPGRSKVPAVVIVMLVAIATAVAYIAGYRFEDLMRLFS